MCETCWPRMFACTGFHQSAFAKHRGEKNFCVLQSVSSIRPVHILLLFTAAVKMTKYMYEILARKTRFSLSKTYSVHWCLFRLDLDLRSSRLFSSELFFPTVMPSCLVRIYSWRYFHSSQANHEWPVQLFSSNNLHCVMSSLYMYHEWYGVVLRPPSS